MPHPEEFALVADDVSAHRQLLAAILKSQGLTVYSVADGLEAVEMAKSHRFGLILMDICMPNLDGIAATRLIREHEDNHAGTRSKIVIVSSHSEQATMDDALEAGADAHVIKPITLHELIMIISGFRVGDYSEYIVRWRNNLNIDHGLIDADHKFIINIINNFLKYARNDLVAAGHILDDLCQYASVHFQREEALQKAIRFPHAAKHRRQHRALFRRLTAIKEKYEQMSFQPDDAMSRLTNKKLETKPSTAELGKLLENWLFNHIISSDVKMRPFAEIIEEQAIGLAPLDHAVAKKFLAEED